MPAKGRVLVLCLSLATLFYLFATYVKKGVTSCSVERDRRNETARCSTGIALGTAPGLAFLHVPKCGGTSLWDFLSRQADAAHLRAYTLGRGKPNWLGLPQSERDATDVYGSNHINYHTLIKSWPGHAENATFVTQLRDPAERLASHYFFVRKNRNHHSYPFVANRTFAEFVRDVRDGYYLQFFLPPDRFHRLDGDGKELRQCCFDRSDLEEVKSLLRDKFAVVGSLEDTDGTLAALECRVPWIRPNEAHRLGHKMVTQHEMPPYDADDMARATRLDRELYDYAKELLRANLDDCGLA